jgi:hypothetical protein
MGRTGISLWIEVVTAPGGRGAVAYPHAHGRRNRLPHPDRELLVAGRFNR